MPRNKRIIELAPNGSCASLVERLAGALNRRSQIGQPIVEERELPRTDKVKVTAIWDLFDGMPDSDRLSAILRAFESAKGQEYCDRIALAMGLTFPEAYESGMLAFQVVPMLRKSDRVTAGECAEAMIEEGASLLFVPDKPQLRFPTREDAQACVDRLVARLPESNEVWAIAEEVGQMHPRIFD
jgi:hypothetical protein